MLAAMLVLAHPSLQNVLTDHHSMPHHHRDQPASYWNFRQGIGGVIFDWHTLPLPPAFGMGDVSPHNGALAAIHGEDSDSDEEADEVFRPRAMGFGVEAVPEGAAAQNTEEESDKDADKKARKAEMDRYMKAIDAKKVIFIHVDLETGGEKVGIVQLSSIAHDSATNIQIGRPFDMYVRPHSRVTADDWSDHATAVHGLHHNHPSIKKAEWIDSVWQKWVTWCHSKIPVW